MPVARKKMWIKLLLHLSNDRDDKINDNIIKVVIKPGFLRAVEKSVNEPEGSFLVAPEQAERGKKSDAGMGNDHCRCALYDRNFCGLLYHRA